MWQSYNSICQNYVQPWWYIQAFLQFCFVSFFNFTFCMQARIYGFCFSVSGLFHSILCFVVVSILIQMAELHSLYSWIMFHCVFFIRSLGDGHLAWTHSLVIMNTVAINMVIRISPWCVYSCLLGIYPVMSLLVHMVNLILVFTEIFLLFFSEAALIYLITNKIYCSLSLHILTSGCYAVSFGF